MEKMNHAFEKVKILVGMEVEEETQAAEENLSFLEDFNRNCTLSTKQRFYGFAICLAAGLTFTLLSMLVFFKPIKFAITFSFGNILSLGRMHECCMFSLSSKSLPGGSKIRNQLLNLATYGDANIYFYFLSNYSIPLPMSTAFLIGPQRQLTMMLDPVRIYATALYIASLVISLFCALYVRNKILTLLAIILEFGALIWYSLSYIPFARSMVSRVMQASFDTEF